MSTPANRMRPASGSTSPVSWPINVVWRAPFGPMIACNSPSGTARLTPSDAMMPPKRRVSPSIASSGSGTAQPQHSIDAAARIKHHEQQQRADDDLRVFGDAGKRLLEHEQRHRSDQRAERRAHPAEHDHD